MSYYTKLCPIKPDIFVHYIYRNLLLFPFGRGINVTPQGTQPSGISKERRIAAIFTNKELRSIDRSYFTVYHAGCYGVTLQSKNTHHSWYIASEDYGNFSTCTIWHSHHEPNTPMHRHGHGKSLYSCICQIKSHDEYQLKKDAKKLRHNRNRRRDAKINEADSLIAQF